MLPYKYVAVNDLTGIQIKAFRTKRGAKWWYSRPVKMLGRKFHRSALFVSIYEISR